MAKKSIASLQTGTGKEHTKCIKMIHSKERNSYSFREEIVHNDKIKDWFSKS